MPSCCSTEPDGTPRASSTCPTPSPQSSCLPAPRAEPGRTTTPSSTPRAPLGETSWPNPRPSHSSECEIGLTLVSRYDLELSNLIGNRLFCPLSAETDLQSANILLSDDRVSSTRFSPGNWIVLVGINPSPVASRGRRARGSMAAPAQRWRWVRGSRGWRRRTRGPGARCRSSTRRPWRRRSSRPCR
jgi:hypothetical protein